MRAALSAVCEDVRLRTVEDGVVVLDYRPVDDAWRRVGISFEAPAVNRSGSGVPL